MLQLIYVSSAAAVTGCTQAEIQSILDTSRTFNHAHEITGLLLYRHFNFMQVLEGPQAVVEELFFKRIVNDGRHHHIQLLRNEEIAERSFPLWAMSFHRVGDSTPAAQAVPGLVAFDQWLKARDPAGFKPAAAVSLLLQFWISWYSPLLHGNDAAVACLSCRAAQGCAR